MNSRGMPWRPSPSPRGVYKIWSSYFCPPPLHDLYFFPNDVNYNEGVRAATKKNAHFFLLQFCKSIWEIIWILFTNWGKNMHFPPFFIPFQSFFSPQLVIWPYFWGQTEKYTPLSPESIMSSFLKTIPLLCMVKNSNLSTNTYVSEKQDAFEF